MPLIGSMNKKLQEEEKANKNGPATAHKPDDYDVLVRNLQFDPKGQVI
jgi:hypothetical protein